jgi:hypothetical protein
VADDPIPRLTTTVIAAVVLREVQRALARYPDWAHPFSGLDYSRARRHYGQARADGRLFISEVFLGTSALDDLEDTVRHELAHLIVGIRLGHGAQWQRVARALGARSRATGNARCEELNRRMTDAPWTLVAVLDDGSEREVKTAFRRSRRYLDYCHRKHGPRYAIHGQVIQRFFYLPRRDGQP